MQQSYSHPSENNILRDKPAVPVYTGKQSTKEIHETVESQRVAGRIDSQLMHENDKFQLNG